MPKGSRGGEKRTKVIGDRVQRINGIDGGPTTYAVWKGDELVKIVGTKQEADRLIKTEQARKNRAKIVQKAQKGFPTEKEVKDALNNLGDRETTKVGNIEIRNYGSFYNIKTPDGYSGGVDLETKGAVIRFLKSSNRLKK